MEEKDYIKELFQEKLAQHESPVSPELWTSISSSITTGTTVVGGGLSIITKSIIGGLGAAAIVGSVWVINRPTSHPPKKHTSQLHSSHQKMKATKKNAANTSLVVGSGKQFVQGDSIGRDLLPEDLPTFGPGITLYSNEPEVIPMLPLQTTVSKPNSPMISGNSLTAQPIKLDIEPAAIIQEETIILPNIFTPNGDGKNDLFSIDLNALEFLDYSLVILDMNNRVVFSSNDPHESWNGKKVDGDACPTGTYIYYLTGKTESGETVSKYSDLRIQY